MRSLGLMLILVALGVDGIRWNRKTIHIDVAVTCKGEPVKGVKIDLYEADTVRDDYYGVRHTGKTGHAAWSMVEDDGVRDFNMEPYLQVYNLKCGQLPELPCLLVTEPTKDDNPEEGDDRFMEFTIAMPLNHTSPSECRHKPKKMLADNAEAVEEPTDVAANSARLMAAHNRIVAQRKLKLRMLAAKLRKPQVDHLSDPVAELLKPADVDEKDPTQRSHSEHLAEERHHHKHHHHAAKEGLQPKPTNIILSNGGHLPIRIGR